jgi:thiol:disulfide interchange protein DsbD
MRQKRFGVWIGLWVMLLSGLAWGQAGRATYSAALNATALRPGDHAVAAVVLDIMPGYHAQSHHPSNRSFIAMQVKAGDTDAVMFGEPVYPEGRDVTYPGLGVLNVYEGQTVVYVPIDVKADAKPGEVEIGGTVTFQICDDRVCYPPQRNKPWSIKTQVVPAGTEVKPANPDLFAGYHGPAAKAEPATAPTTQAAQAGSVPPTPIVTGGEDAGFSSTWAAFGAAFVAGLLFNIMPCVLPVLPLKAVGFYEVSQHRRGQSIAFGVVFSLGLIAVFAVLAMLVLVLRVVSWGGLFSHGWFVWTIVAILVAMALGLFGAFTFQLPTAVYNVTPRHDTYLGNFLFGGLTAILATPCTAPLLPALLLWAASRPGYVGVPAFIMVGVGMASPYLVLSAFPEVARRFPRAGAGAELFKQMMAFLLLIAAAYFAAGRLVHGTSFWWVVTAAVAVAALFLLARTVQITKGAGAVAAASVLAVAMVGGTAWWSARVNGLGRPAAASAAGPTADATWTPYSTAAFESARSAGNPVLVKFTANWCATCQYIEGTVFTDPAVWDELHRKGVTTLKADFTDDNPEAQTLLLSLNPSGGLPLTAVYFPGQDRPVTLGSVYTSSTLLDILKQINPAPTAAPAATAAAR